MLRATRQPVQMGGQHTGSTWLNPTSAPKHHPNGLRNTIKPHLHRKHTTFRHFSRRELCDAYAATLANKSNVDSRDESSPSPAASRVGAPSFKMPRAAHIPGRRKSRRPPAESRQTSPNSAGPKSKNQEKVESPPQATNTEVPACSITAQHPTAETCLRDEKAKAPIVLKLEALSSCEEDSEISSDEEGICAW